MENLRERLLCLLRAKSYKYRINPPFRLASGRMSPYYVDCKPTMHNAEGKELIGQLIFDKIKHLQVTAVGGLTMGADPIASAISLISYQKGNPINSFSVRKTTKDHGIIKRVEGDIQPGERIIIVDDVITTGKSVIEAIKAAQDYGLKIERVVVLVDREEGGREEIEKWIHNVESVFKLSELKDRDECKDKGNSIQRDLSRTIGTTCSSLRR